MKKQKKIPIIMAFILGFAVFIYTFPVGIIIKGLMSKTDTVSQYIANWHIISGFIYIVVLVYTYRKRNELALEKINFLVYSGFLIFLFVNYIGCVALGNILK